MLDWNALFPPGTFESNLWGAAVQDQAFMPTAVSTGSIRCTASITPFVANFVRIPRGLSKKNWAFPTKDYGQVCWNGRFVSMCPTWSHAWHLTWLMKGISIGAAVGPISETTKPFSVSTLSKKASSFSCTKYSDHKITCCVRAKKFRRSKAGKFYNYALLPLTCKHDPST